MDFMRAASVVLLAMFALPADAPATSPPVQIAFLAVGQGDAGVYRGPCGEVGVVDANRGADDEVLAQIDAWGPRSLLRWLSVSHYDADHLGDIEDVGRADGVSLEAVYDRGGDRDVKDSQTYRDYFDWVTGAGIRQPVDIGDRFTLCSGSEQVVFTVVSAGTDGTAAGGVAVSEENDRGICVLVTYRDFDLASCGDVNGTDEGSRADVESAVAPAYGDVEVVKVNHHGARFSSSTTYVCTLTPEVAVISLGSNNFGHPASAVVSRWEGVGDVLQTQDADGAVQDGTVTIVTSGTTFEVVADGSEFSGSYTVDEAREVADTDVVGACPR